MWQVTRNGAAAPVLFCFDGGLLHAAHSRPSHLDPSCSALPSVAFLPCRHVLTPHTPLQLLCVFSPSGAEPPSSLPCPALPCPAGLLQA